MIFDFEDRYFDTPTIEAAMSWREQVLLSVLAHVLVVLLVLFVPQLPFVQEAEALRLARLAELQELQELQEQQQLALAADQNRTFVYIEPLVDFEADQAPNPNAPLSDRDRIAQSPTAAEDPLNNLPNADGNSMRFVESEDPSDALQAGARGRRRGGGEPGGIGCRIPVRGRERRRARRGDGRCIAGRGGAGGG